ncbi:MAG: protein-methionine-sulfoxide reductase heme-binding subunit MsrQ [Robiginitomaculum sp.]|nr:protein-methionine-sulfoxide reductase heme-binding subunit MsrQ [Robiginitomaculum sp.]
MAPKSISLTHLKAIFFIALSLPALWLGWQWALLLGAHPNDLGVNPVEATNRFLGDTALRVLLITLAITPLRDLTGYAPLTRLRRMAGLFAFFYVCLHLASYLGLDLFFSLAKLWKDIVKRTYITLGMSAFALLIPLALTSTNASIRRLGPRRWARLHTLIYPAAILAVVHHVFMAKGFQIMPLVHGAILFFLLGWRVVKWQRKNTAQKGNRISKSS